MQSYSPDFMQPLKDFIRDYMGNKFVEFCFDLSAEFKRNEYKLLPQGPLPVQVIYLVEQVKENDELCELVYWVCTRWRKNNQKEPRVLRGVGADKWITECMKHLRLRIEEQHAYMHSPDNNKPYNWEDLLAYVLGGQVITVYFCATFPWIVSSEEEFPVDLYIQNNPYFHPCVNCPHYIEEEICGKLGRCKRSFRDIRIREKVWEWPLVCYEGLDILVDEVKTVGVTCTAGRSQPLSLDPNQSRAQKISCKFRPSHGVPIKRAGISIRESATSRESVIPILICDQQTNPESGAHQGGPIKPPGHRSGRSAIGAKAGEPLVTPTRSQTPTALHHPQRSPGDSSTARGNSQDVAPPQQFDAAAAPVSDSKAAESLSTSWSILATSESLASSGSLPSLATALLPLPTPAPDELPIADVSQLTGAFLIEQFSRAGAFRPLVPEREGIISVKQFQPTLLDLVAWLLVRDDRYGVAKATIDIISGADLLSVFGSMTHRLMERQGSDLIRTLLFGTQRSLGIQLYATRSQTRTELRITHVSLGRGIPVNVVENYFEFDQDWLRMTPGDEWLEALGNRVSHELNTAAENRPEGLNIRRLGIAFPADFDDIARNKIRLAVKQTGIDKVVDIEGPLAAALACYPGNGDLIVMVCILHAGPFEVAVLKRDHKGAFMVFASGWNREIGGTVLDERLALWMIERLAGTNTSPAALRDFLDRQDRQEWLRRARRVRLRLLDQPQCLLSEIGYLPPASRVNIEVTREDFYSLIHDDIERTWRLCSSVLERADISASRLDQILVVGEYGRLPALIDGIEPRFGHKPRIEGAERLAEGAAIGAMIQDNGWLRGKINGWREVDSD